MPLQRNNAEALARYVQHEVTRGSSYMEAVMTFCADRQLEPESIAPFISDKIKAALGEEAERLHLIPRRSALPL